MTKQNILTYIFISALFLLSFISNAAMTDHFVTTWKTDNPGFTNDTSIYIQTHSSDTYLYDVDWNNDGIFDEFGLTGSINHDFGTSGIKTIRITGNFPRIYFPDNYDNKKIISIDQWGTFPWTSMAEAFFDASNLINNASDVPNLSICSDLSLMFYGARSVGSAIETGNWNWDTSHITNMRAMFSDAVKFNQDISNWDTSQVTDMIAMFNDAIEFNQNIGNWNTSVVTNLSFMFTNATAFNQNIGNWNTSQVIDMNSMFNNAVVFNQNIGNWNTSQVIDMNSMFSNAIEFNKDIGNWNTSQVIDMNSMFSNTVEFNKDIGNWNTSQVIDMNSMFSNAVVFNQNIGNWDTSLVSSMNFMFFRARSFDQDIGQWNVENVNFLLGMFKHTRLSIENYNALLIGWSTQNLLQNNVFDAGNAIHCSQAAQDAHNILMSTYGWKIYDRGRCKPSLTIISKDRIFVDENQLEVTQVHATDADFNTINFSIAGGVDQSFFSIDTDTGILSFNNPPDYENPLDSDNDNYYSVDITATDDGSPQENTNQSITVIVKNVFENLANDDFVTTWQTNNRGITNDTSITIQAHSNLEYSFNVDWDNDGIFDEFGITGDITHNYATSGIKTIRISGQYPLIHFESGNSDVEKIIAINQWGTNQWNNMFFAFENAINIVNNATDIPNLSASVSLYAMFANTTLIGAESETANWDWDISNILSSEYMFSNADSFNQDISQWDTSNISSMSFMFLNATTFNQNINNWDTYNTSKMKNMFNNAIAFNQDISSWTIKRVTQFEDMFKNTQMSVANYDSLLINWSTQILFENFTFHAGNSTYCSQEAIDAHHYLTSIKEWDIIDNGKCQADLTIITDNRLFVDENQTHVSQIMASDPDFDNFSFTITGGVDQSFFNIDTNSGLLTFNAPPDYENPMDENNDNSYIVEIRVTDDGSPQETKTQLFTISINNIFENLPSDDFVTTWKTDNPGNSNDSSITIQTSSNHQYFYDIDWNNDGVFDELGITGSVSHDYGTPGIRTIRIKGTFPIFRFSNFNSDREKIISIDQWGTNPWQTLIGSFKKANNLTNNALDTPNLSYCTILSNLFRDSPLVGSSSEISNWNWNTENIESMSFMFSGALAFNKDIGNWKTTNVTTMESMFENARAFNQDIGNWNTNRVEYMRSMFENAVLFNQDLGRWNMENIFLLDNMFKGAQLSIENYDALLTGWSSQNLSSSKTFDAGNSVYCSQAAQAAHNNLTNNFNWQIFDKGSCQPQLSFVSSDVVHINENQSHIIQLVASDPQSNNTSYSISGGDDQNFVDLDSITGMLTFINPPDYENPQDINNDNIYIIEVTAINDATPQETTNQILTIIIKNVYEDLANDDFITTWDTRLGGDITSSTITIPTVSSFDYSYNVDWDNDGVFDELGITGTITHDFITPGIKTIRISGIFPSIRQRNNTNELTKMTSIDQWGTNPWLNMNSSFRDASNLINKASDTPNLSLCTDISWMFNRANEVGSNTDTGNWNWDTSNVVNMQGVFNSASKFNKTIRYWNTTRVKDMTSMFRSATSFNHDVGNWDITNVSLLSEMFKGASSFNQNIGRWNTIRTTSMEAMFKGASSFNQNIGTWDTKSVRSMDRMFENASSFNQNIGNWNTIRVRSMESMFENASSFNQNIGTWDTKSVRSMDRMFENAVIFNQDLSQWNVENITEFSDMFKFARLSVENYDALLIGWNSQILNTSRNFNAGSSIYCSHAAQAAHNNMTSILNWSIQDHGVCAPQLTIVSIDFPRVEENHTIVIKVLTTDPDFDNVSFAITGGIDQTSFSINQNSGLLRFNNPPDFENPTDTTGNNNYQVEVTAMDDGTPQEFATQMLNVRVTNLEETSPIDLNLQITTNTNIVNIGETVEFDITITNQGTENALNAVIFDILPNTITNSTWVCNSTGTATCSFAGSGEIMEIVTIPNDSSSITYTVTATLGNKSFVPLTYQAFAEAIEPHYDTDLSNNNDTITLTFDIIFSNGFD